MLIIFSSFIAVCIFCLLFLLPYIIPVNRYQISNADTMPGNSTILMADSDFQDVMVTQDTKTKDIYVDIASINLQFSHLDVPHRFKIPCNSLISKKNIQLVWYLDEKGTKKPTNLRGNLLSARITITVHGKILFNHLESFIERYYTLPGWLCVNTSIGCEI